MIDKTCKCGTNLKDQTNVFLTQSLMGGGMSAYCRKCNGLIRAGMNDKDDIPDWIKQAYQSFWKNFDPETF